eukprot:s459_g24.t1
MGFKSRDSQKTGVYANWALLTELRRSSEAKAELHKSCGDLHPSSSKPRFTLQRDDGSRFDGNPSLLGGFSNRQDYTQLTARHSNLFSSLLE